MNDWYIDRSKNFINDNLVETLKYLAKTPKVASSTDIVAAMNSAGLLGRAGGNPNAALTRFRDHGLLTIDNKIGDSAYDFVNGLLGTAELVIDLFFKRPAKKQDSPNVKPFVLLCIFFDYMMEMSIDPDDIFITYYECYEYLYPIEHYKDVTYELVEKVLAEREFDMDNRYPTPRVRLPENEDTNLSIWFNALKETPVFMPQNADRPVLRPNLKQREFFKFISVNADEVSETPTHRNGDLYRYYCDRNTGLLEIIPKVVRKEATITEDETKVLFEYLFGYKKQADFNYSKFLKYECFGLFFPFITLPRLVIRQIYLSNRPIGEAFYQFIMQNNGYVVDFEKGIFEYKGSYKDNVDTQSENKYQDILNHEVFGIHITKKNNALSQDNPHVCIGWSRLGDLSAYADKDALISRYEEVFPDKTRRGRGQDIGQIWTFYDKISVGDYIVFGDGRTAHIGKITSNYYYSTENTNQDDDYVNNRAVQWLKDVSYKDLPQGLHSAFYATRSIFSLNEYKAAILDILNERAAEDEDVTTSYEVGGREMPIREPRSYKQHSKTYATAEYALAIIEHREVDHSLKTAEQRAELMEKYNSLVSQGQIVFTTFHQSYGYEDFIQGLRPETQDGGFDFRPVDGVFKRIADMAMDDSENEYVIIIDEINRANISKVFGELITLIEDDKRWGEPNAISITLPSGEKFAVPNNLYIIGTMNSADKSISLIDTALRRRFEFVEVVPNYETISDQCLKQVLQKLNKGLVEELDSTDLLIGHSYFIGKTQEDLCEIMNRSIIPLLYEYFFDNSKKVKEQVSRALEGLSFGIKDSPIGRIKVIRTE